MNRNSTLKRTGFPKPSFADALAARIAKRGKDAESQTGIARASLKRGNKPLKAKPDRKLAAWGRQVKMRDGNQCQWPGISAELIFRFGYKAFDVRLALRPCATGDTRIDPHHIAEKSLRPDLKYSIENGLALCRTHHDWIPLNRAAAIALGILSDETYEKAQRAA